MVTDLALLRLLQLISPSLPIGMYCYSQGLERAVDERLIMNENQTHEWLEGIMVRGIARIDLPLLVRFYDAWQQQEVEQIRHWSHVLIAYRETAELRAEDQQTGQALARLLDGLGIDEMRFWVRSPDVTLANIFAFAAVYWHIPMREAVLGYLWSWLENQVLCAVKLVPLGQVAGQKLLANLSNMIPSLVDVALTMPDEAIGGSALGIAFMSSRHETQYSRLFRS